MFTSSAQPAILPRPAYPDVPRLVEEADLRTRQLAEAMIRLNAEHPDGATEAVLLVEGFSCHEQQHLGPVARQLANRIFVREVGADEGPAPGNKDALDLARQMADVLVREVGRSDSTVIALQRAGYTGRQIAAHIDRASAIADRLLLRKAPPNASLTALAYAIGNMVTAAQPTQVA